MQNNTEAVQKLRMQCFSRGSAGIKGIVRLFRKMDSNNSGYLEFEEFKAGIEKYELQLNEQEIKDLFETFDKDKNNKLDSNELINALEYKPPLPPNRLPIVMEAFKSIDKTKDGKITVADFRKVYNARQHPRYKDGEWTEHQVFKTLLDSFDLPNEDGVVTEDEFIKYYSGLSASIKDDEYFELMIKNAWKLN